MAHPLQPVPSVEALNTLIRDFCDAWNRHDVDALAHLWTEDGELTHPWGDHAVGRDAVRELLSRDHSGLMSRSRIDLHLRESRAEDGRAFVEAEGTLRDVLAPNGRAYDLHHRISAMFVSQGPTWRIRAMAPIANPR